MRETGIVRRIDELGRVVIPKEIRKTLRIKEGDPLEIYTEKDELVFKKYSPIAEVNEMAKMTADAISEMTECACVVTDTDSIIVVSGGKKDMIGKSISGEIDKVLQERKSVVIRKIDGGEILPLYKGVDISSENQILVPILSYGDCYGVVALFDKEKVKKPLSEEIKIVQLGAKFLSKQFE